jgi:shikimate kinase
MVSPRVVIVGAPGAGKTTVGGLLAAALQVELHDTDHAVEAVAGKSVPEIFFDDGEETFRRLETAAVANALASESGVVSLGGGAVMSAATRTLLRESGAPVLWLQVGLPDAAKRVGLARDRPVLALNPRGQLHTLLAERAPLYEEVATITVDTDGRDAEAVAALALALLA